jgi:hypothetical protein
MSKVQNNKTANTASATVTNSGLGNSAAKITPSKSKTAGVLFTKENHKWMMISAAIMILGFVLMIGGDSKDPNAFNANEVYSFVRITLAPILVLVGLSSFVYAILKKG